MAKLATVPAPHQTRSGDSSNSSSSGSSHSYTSAGAGAGAGAAACGGGGGGEGGVGVAALEKRTPQRSSSAPLVFTTTEAGTAGGGGGMRKSSLLHLNAHLHSIIQQQWPLPLRWGSSSSSSSSTLSSSSASSSAPTASASVGGVVGLHAFGGGWGGEYEGHEPDEWDSDIVLPLLLDLLQSPVRDDQWLSVARVIACALALECALLRLLMHIN